MRGCTETDNTVVVGCYKLTLGIETNGLRHCQFDPVSSGYQKLLLTSAAVNHNRLWGTHSSSRGVLHQSVGVKGGRL